MPPIRSTPDPTEKQAPHWLVHHAYPNAGACKPHLTELRVLTQAYNNWNVQAPVHLPSNPAGTPLSSTADWALATRLGLPLHDGLLPWAALHGALQTHERHSTAPQAFVTLCHWAVGMGDAVMQDPSVLGLTPTEDQQLFELLQHWLTEDGITLHALPGVLGCFRATGPGVPLVATASLSRVIGGDVNAWLPGDASAAHLRRLQNEFQMLMYNHPLNDARAAARQRSVNSIWWHGTGVLPAGFDAAAARATLADIHQDHTLSASAAQQDWASWADAWSALDARLGQRLQAVAAGTAPALQSITLCGARGYQRLNLAPNTFSRRLKRFFKPMSSTDGLSLL